MHSRSSVSPATLPEQTSARCVSCGTALQGNYCHACGEKRLDRHDYALGHFLEHLVDAFTHFDFKVPKAFWSLLRHPGQMTAEVLAGRRVMWAKPIQVFLIANLLYYVLASVLHLNTFETPLRFHQSGLYGALARTWSSTQGARLGLDAATYAARFDALAHTLAKTLVIFFVPVFALLFGLLARRARRYALEHVTVGLHFTSLVLLLLPLPYPLIWALVRGGVMDVAFVDALWTSLTTLLVGFYASRFAERVYGASRAAAIAQSVAVVVGFYLALLFLYRPLLFFIVHAVL